MKVNVTLHTDGTSLWSDNGAKAVKINKITVKKYECRNMDDFGSMNLYFTPKSWNVDKDGLIYTDDQFQKEAIDFLKSMGLDTTEVGYSEQGLQGDTYVNFDVDKNFLESWADQGLKTRVIKG